MFKSRNIQLMCLTLLVLMGLGACEQLSISTQNAATTDPIRPIDAGVADKATMMPIVNKNKPNIIVILSDDQSFNTLPNLGNNEIHAPNLQKLAQNGITFSHAYNMGGWNGAVCLASRAMLNTGRTLWQAKNLEAINRATERRDTTWAKLMQSSGYQTYFTGKWHVHLKAKNTFNIVKNVRAGMPEDGWDHQGMINNFNALKAGDETAYDHFMPAGYNRPQNETDTSWSPIDTAFGGFYEGGKHWSEVLKDDAINFIHQASVEQSTPFFMYLAFNAPHDPRQAPNAYQQIYNTKQLSLPDNWQPTYPFQDKIGNGPELRDSALAPFPRTAFAIKTHKKEYYASISHMDAQIGAILDQLEKQSLLENTYIIFTSDHGLAVGEHGLFGKQNMYEHSVRAPFIIAGPKLAKNQIISTPIYIQDSMATTLDLAGIPKPDHVFFNSVLPLVNKTHPQSYYEHIYGAYINLQRMIIEGDYKLIAYPDAQSLRLYNLKNDPNEKQDLAQDVTYNIKVKALFKSLTQLQRNMNDPLDLTPIYADYFE